MIPLTRMWARTIEILLAAWLIVGAVLTGQSGLLLIHDACVAVLIAAISAHAVAKRSNKKHHLWNGALGLWLFGLAFFFSRDVNHAAAQNQLLVGLAVAMFSIIPTRTVDLPAAWRDFYNGARES